MNLFIRVILAGSMVVGLSLASVIHYVTEHKQQKRATKVEPVNIDDLYDLRNQVKLSQSNRKIPFTKKEMLCMTKNIFFEAGTEDVMGKYAVAQVVVNRLELGHWGDTVCKVVYSKDQFSWTKSRKLRNSKVEGKNWEDSYKVALAVFDGMRVRNLEKALFYHADYVNPFWKDPGSRIAKIGRHIFYEKAQGSWLEVEDR